MRRPDNFSILVWISTIIYWILMLQFIITLPEPDYNISIKELLDLPIGILIRDFITIPLTVLILFLAGVGLIIFSIWLLKLELEWS